METYEFRGCWVHISTPPGSTGRYIVTDGDTIVVGTYVGDAWLLEGINASTPYKIIGWMETPKPMKKIVSYEKTDSENKGLA